MLVSEVAQMSAAEETMWIAYYREQPFGDQRADTRNALIAQLLYNTNVKKGKTKKLQDFMLYQPETVKPVRYSENIDDEILGVFGRLMTNQSKK